MQYNIHAAKAHFSELIQRALLGEPVIIARDNHPIVQLIRLSLPFKRRLGSAKGLVTFSHDFNEPLNNFDEYQ